MNKSKKKKAINSIKIISADQTEKINVFIKFVESFIEYNDTDSQIDIKFKLGAYSWNLLKFSEKALFINQEELDRDIELSLTHKFLIKRMRQEREKLYSDYKYTLNDFEISFDEDGYQINAWAEDFI